MKYIFYLIMLIMPVSFIYLSEESNQRNPGEGILFFSGTWEQAIQKSAEDHKPIFLDVSASWCGPCKMLKRTTFPDKKVGEYFNANFINMEVDGDSSEGRFLAAKYNVRGYPTLMIIDGQGKVITATAGYHSPAELLQFGQTVLIK